MKLPIMAPMQECPKCLSLGELCPRHRELEEKKNDKYYKKIMNPKPTLTQLRTDLEIYQEGVAEAPNTKVRDHYTKLCKEICQKIEDWKEPVLTTRAGLLWWDDKVQVDVREADRLAREQGFQYAEQLVKHLEEKHKPSLNWRPVVGSLLKKLQTHGFTLVSVNDGDEDHTLVGTDRDKRQQAKAAICAVDEASLYVDTSEGVRKWIYIVLGNAPEELVADCSGSGLDEVLEEFSKQWEGKSCPTN